MLCLVTALTYLPANRSLTTVLMITAMGAKIASLNRRRSHAVQQHAQNIVFQEGV